MIRASGEAGVSRNLAETAALYAVMTDEDVAASDTPLYDAKMRDWALRWIEMSPDERFNAHRGWPADHRIEADCSCSICSAPAHLRGNHALNDANAAERQARWEVEQAERLNDRAP